MTKRILDEETRQKLLGYLPFSAEATIEFTPHRFSKDIPSEYIPVFSLRSFTEAERQQLAKNHLSYKQDMPQEQIDAVYDSNKLLLRACIMGWRSYFDVGTKEEVEYRASPSGGCDETVFKRLPDWIVLDLLRYVSRISVVSAPEDLSLK
jgi:hypothetical protein